MRCRLIETISSVKALAEASSGSDYLKSVVVLIYFGLASMKEDIDVISPLAKGILY
jgi:hypothetical protein